MPSSPQQLRLSVLKVLAFCLMFGLVALSAVSVYLVTTKQFTTSPANTRLFSLMLAVAGVVLIPLALIIGPGFVAAARRQWETRREDVRAGDWLLNQFGTLTIVRYAILDGWGLLGTVCYLITGECLILIAPAFTLVLMLVLLPTESKVRAFITRVTGQVPQ